MTNPLSLADAAKLVGKHESTLRRDHKSGKLPLHADATGSELIFDASDLLRIYGSSPEDLESISLIEFQKSLFGALKDSNNNTQKAYELVFDPVNKILERYVADNDRKQARIEYLEKAHDEAVRAREAALNEASDREIAATQALASETRKDMIWSQAAKLLPVALGSIEGTKLKGVLDSIETKHLKELVDALELPGDGKAVVQSYLANRSKRETAAAKKEKKQS